MTPDQLKDRIQELAPGTRAWVKDLTGTQDHYDAVVVSDAFAGKGLMDQHRLIYDLLSAEMASNEVHALALKTMTPQEFENWEGKSHVGS